ncbi:hypothetical protein ACVWYG_001738 [Pedobacter sp. UYEF25]
MRSVKYWLIMLFLGLTYNVVAQVGATGSGCYVASQNVIYIGGQLLNVYILSGQRSTICGSMATNTTPYYQVQMISMAPCTALLSSGLNANGKISDYTIKNCPLDENLPLILLFSGGLGVLFLRKSGLLLG